jgi:predicted RNA-binding protein Jag
VKRAAEKKVSKAAAPKSAASAAKKTKVAKPEKTKVAKKVPASKGKKPAVVAAVETEQKSVVASAPVAAVEKVETPMAQPTPMAPVATQVNGANGTITPAEKKSLTEPWLTELFKLMEYPAKFEFKDLEDGSLGVALHFDGNLPGITPGKRTWLVECMQFILNKVVNRPHLPRRWVNLGVNDFPLPRMPKPPPEPRAPKVAAPPQAPARHQSANPAHAPRPAVDLNAPPPPAREKPPRIDKPGSVSSIPEWTILGQTLAEKSAKHGRYYGVMLLSHDNRARLSKAAMSVNGCRTRIEGEGHWTRVVFSPDKPVIIAKRQVMPDYGAGDEEE